MAARCTHGSCPCTALVPEAARACSAVRLPMLSTEHTSEQPLAAQAHSKMTWLSHTTRADVGQLWLRARGMLAA